MYFITWIYKLLECPKEMSHLSLKLRIFPADAQPTHQGTTSTAKISAPQTEPSTHT